MTLDIIMEVAAIEPVVKEASMTTGKDVTNASLSTHPLRMVVVKHMVVVDVVGTTSRVVEDGGSTVDTTSLEEGMLTPVGGTKWRSSLRAKRVVVF
jgi:hypothetical protein